LSDSSIFTDDKDSIIDDWLSVMRNKLEENANWFLIDVQQKTYVRIRLDEDVMKHLIFRFIKNSIKSYTTADEIFDDLYQIFDVSRFRVNLLVRVSVSRRLVSENKRREFINSHNSFFLSYFFDFFY
jgi:hypothetical protein